MHRPAFLIATLLLLLGPGQASAADATIEASAQAYPWGPGTGLGGRLQADHPFVSLETRGAWGGSWSTRVTGGVDLFSSDKLDLSAGAFLGGASSWPEDLHWGAPMLGYELGLGLGVGAVKARYRHVHGQRARADALTWACEDCPAGPWLEEQFRLSVDVGERVSVFGELLLQDPCRYDTDSYRAYGLGAVVGL